MLLEVLDMFANKHVSFQTERTAMHSINNTNETLSIDKKFALTIEEASHYFGIGETNLREICRTDALSNTFTCKVKSKTVIIREKFEKHMLEHHILLAG